MPLVVDKDNPKITIINSDGQPETIDNVYIQYTIPDKYKEMCTLEFLTELRRQLFRIHDFYSLELFADDGIPLNTSTSGWYAAFWKACKLCGKEELLHYHSSLPWYDSDIFDGEIAEMLISNGLILNDIEYYAKKYGIIESDEEIKFCNKCFQFYIKEDVHPMPQNDEDYEFLAEDDFVPMVCSNCGTDKKEAPTLVDRILDKIQLPDFCKAFVNNDKIKQIKLKAFLRQELGITNKIYRCSCCGHIYDESMGKIEDQGFICDYCNDVKANDGDVPTSYYKQILSDIRKYHHDSE